MSNALRILVTRPSPKGERLAKTLSEKLDNVAHIEVQPLLYYQRGSDLTKLKTIAEQYQSDSAPIFIFVSQQAVLALFNEVPLHHLPSKATYFAVGKATKQALENVGIKDVLTPQERETSEGLLALPELNKVVDKQVLIVRGDGGRDLLKQELENRGAAVTYLEVYKRIWHALGETDSHKWQQQGINCVILTSKEALEKWLTVVNTHSDYWQSTTLVVVSERIAKAARAHGFEKVINAQGAGDESIVTALKQAEKQFNLTT